MSRERFAALFGISSRTVLRWELHGVKPNKQQRVLIQVIEREYDLEQLTQFKETTMQNRISQFFVETMVKVLPAIASNITSTVLAARCKVMKAMGHLPRNHAETTDLLPPWHEELRRDWSDENWNTLARFGKHFLKLNEADRAKRQLGVDGVPRWECEKWIAVALLRTGHFDESRKLLQELQDDCKYNPLLADVLANLAHVYLRLNALSQAKKTAANALAIEPGHVPALLNAIAISSQQADAECCGRLAKELVKHHPAALDPANPVGDVIQSDVDLEFFRGTAEFRSVFECDSEPKSKLTKFATLAVCFLLLGAKAAVTCLSIVGAVTC